MHYYIAHYLYTCASLYKAKVIRNKHFLCAIYTIRYTNNLRRGLFLVWAAPAKETHVELCVCDALMLMLLGIIRN